VVFVVVVVVVVVVLLVMVVVVVVVTVDAAAYKYSVCHICVYSLFAFSSSVKIAASAQGLRAQVFPQCENPEAPQINVKLPV
jgi:hypothetical protein